MSRRYHNVIPSLAMLGEVSNIVFRRPWIHRLIVLQDEGAEECKHVRNLLVVKYAVAMNVGEVERSEAEKDGRDFVKAEEGLSGERESPVKSGLQVLLLIYAEAAGSEVAVAPATASLMEGLNGVRSQYCQARHYRCHQWHCPQRCPYRIRQQTESHRVGSGLAFVDCRQVHEASYRAP